MKKVSFYVDGFNLYYSLNDVLGRGEGNYKWLDVKALCKSQIAELKRQWGESDLKLGDIRFFTAISKGGPDKKARQNEYLKCLKNSGVLIEMGRFKKKRIVCPHCEEKFNQPEEKETDVAIACKAIEDMVMNRTDYVVFMSGDTDIKPAAQTIMNLFGTQCVAFVFPNKRHNNELEKMVTAWVALKVRAYRSNQFPDPVILTNGRKVSMPSDWG